MSRRGYSLENKFYPLSSLENEMERLFGKPVWYEEKMKIFSTNVKEEKTVTNEFGKYAKQFD